MLNRVDCFIDVGAPVPEKQDSHMAILWASCLLNRDALLWPLSKYSSPSTAKISSFFMIILLATIERKWGQTFNIRLSFSPNVHDLPSQFSLFIQPSVYSRHDFAHCWSIYPKTSPNLFYSFDHTIFKSFSIEFWSFDPHRFARTVLYVNEILTTKYGVGRRWWKKWCAATSVLRRNVHMKGANK